MGTIRVEQQDRAHRPFALILDEMHEEGQDLSERRAGHDHLEHLMLAGLERLCPPQR
jgi:hypothetical protein